MSKSDVAKIADPLGIVKGNKVLDPLGVTKKPDAAPAAAAAPAGPAAPAAEVASRSADLTNKAAVLSSQARAAGATRNLNQADLLGNANSSGTKRKDASKTLLGQ